MPFAPPSPCRHFGCGRLAQGGRCPEHKRQHQRSYERQRGSAAARGYDRRWRTESKEFLREHPWCEMACRDRGILTPSTMVEHRRPHRGDPALFWDRSNWQAGCKSCADRKTASRDGGFGNPAKG